MVGFTALHSLCSPFSCNSEYSVRRCTALCGHTASEKQTRVDNQHTLVIRPSFPTSQPLVGSRRHALRSPSYGPKRSPTITLLRLQTPSPPPRTSDSRSSKSGGTLKSSCGRKMLWCRKLKVSPGEESTSESRGDAGSSARADEGAGSPSEPHTSSKMSEG